MLSTWKNDASPAAKHTFAGALQPSGLRMTLCCETRRYRVPPTHSAPQPLARPAAPTLSPPPGNRLLRTAAIAREKGNIARGERSSAHTPSRAVGVSRSGGGGGEAPYLRSTVTFAHPSIPSTVCKQWSHSWDRSLKIKSRHKLQVQTQELTYGMITL